MSIYSWIISTNNIFFLNYKKNYGAQASLYYLLNCRINFGSTSILASNTNTKLLFKNIALWGIIVLVIIFFIKYFGLHHFI